MKNIIAHTLIGALAASMLLTGNTQAQEMPPLPHLALARLDVPVESPGLPYYVRLSPGGDFWALPSNDQWSVIVFLRDQDCIPLDFNLAEGFHLPGPDGLGAFGCKPLHEGFDLRFTSLDMSTPPDYIFTRNSTLDLPIWFVATPELMALLDRGFVYIDEIEALPSRVSGRAWHMEEQVMPFGTNPEATLRMTASGRLDTGGQFSFFWFHKAAVPDFLDPSNSTLLENVFELNADLPTLAPPAPQRPPNVKCFLTPRPPGCRD